MSKQYDLLIRLLVIGDSGVGKTCLLCRYVDGRFHPSYAATIGIDFKVKNIVIDGTRIRVQIWDTAGQERFDIITKQYYRRAQGVLLVYDIANSSSFRHVDKWLTFLRQHGNDKCDVTLVGNKTDLDEWRQVPQQELAEKNGFGFSETSAYGKENDGVDDMFEEIIRRILVNQAEELAAQHVDSYIQSESDEEDGGRARRAAREESKCCTIS